MLPISSYRNKRRCKQIIIALDAKISVWLVLHGCMRINKGRRTHTKRNLMKKIRRKPFKWWSRKEQVRLFGLGSSQSRRCVTPEAMRGHASMMHNVLPESIGILSRQKKKVVRTHRPSPLPEHA